MKLINNYHYITLIELVTLQRGHDLPKKLRKSGQYPIISSSGIIDYHHKCKSKGPGVIIGRSGKLGLSHYTENNYWPLNTTLYSKKFHDSDPKFVYYLIKTLNLENFNAGTSVPTLNRNHIHTLEIFVPTQRNKQKKIGKILYDLDTKIENLQKQNKILEQIAQAIFKSWFVDFDGQTEFADSELGKIPKGWTVRDLGDICEIIMGQSPPSISYNKNGDGIIFFQGITDFGNFFPTPRIYCTSPKKFAEKNDILFTVRAPISAINIAKERCSIGRGLASLRLKENHGSFLYYLLKNSFQKWQKFESQGTVYGSVTRDDIYNFKIIIPLTKIIILFNQIIDPLYYYIWNNNEQMQSLTKTRDAILPKLMSGEIRV